MYKSDYESLVSNPVWKELLATCDEVVRGIYVDLGALDPITEATDIARKQGRLTMVAWFLAQPKEILREIEEKIEQTEKRGE